MKIHIRKVLSITVALFLLMSISAISAMAEDGSHSGGLIWDTWESITADLNEATLRAFADQRTGDVDGDGRITAADARLCLRVSAQLEEIEYAQSVSADIDGNGKITSADARKILRFSASLDTPEAMSYELDLSGWGFIIGPVKSTGSGRFYWQCEVDTEGLSFTEESVDNTDGKDGASPEYFFVFTAEKEGSYTVTFTLADTAKSEIIDTFTINVKVNNNNAEEMSSDMG